MKFTHSILCLAAFGLTASAPVRAADPVEPPARQPSTTLEVVKPAVKMKRVAFLGVMTMPIAPDAAKALGLDEGMGLSVQMVAPQSPAEEAGVRHDDVIVKIDDQLVVNSPQLQTLIRLHKANDTVTLVVRREGKDIALPVKLVERDMPAVPHEMLTIHRMGEASQLPRDFGATGATIPMIDLNMTAGATVVSSDGDTTLTCRLVEDHMTAQAVQGGKVVYDGPIVLDKNGNVDPEANKQVPANVLDKVRALTELGGPFKRAREAAPATQP